MRLESIINKVYKTNGNKFQLKLEHDIVCRKIAKHLSADSVSILMYNGPSNNLRCKGRFINPHKSKANIDYRNCPLSHLQQIIENIDIWEYFHKSENSGRIADYNTYVESKLFDINISLSEFNNFKILNDNPSIKKQYLLYKKCFNEEVHPVGLNETLSGKYYYFIHNSDIFDDEQSSDRIINSNTKICITNLKNKKGILSSCRKNLRKNLKIELNEGGIYIGVPLVSSSNRTIGILRMTFRLNVFKNLIPDFTKPSMYDLSDILEKEYELSNIAGIIGDRLSNHELLDGFRKISLKKHLNQEFQDYNILANELTRVINCFGSIVRVEDSEGKFKIVGSSIHFKEYIDLIYKGKDPFIRDKNLINPLKEIFNSDEKKSLSNNKSIIGIKIKFKIGYKPRFKYYVLDEEDNLLEQTKTNFKDKNSINLFENKLQNVLRDARKNFEYFDIKEIVLMPFIGVENSLITLFNKSVHPFDIRDIELIYIVVKRVGLEFKYIEKNTSEKKKGKEEALKDGTRILFHQLGAPISALNQHIINISRGYITDKEKIALRLEEMEHTYNDFLDMLKTNQFFSDFTAKGRISVQNTRFNISKFIIDKIRSYQLRAKKEKGLDIIYEEDSNTTETGILSDKFLLGHIIQCLVDNAIKYSFSYSDRSINSMILEPNQNSIRKEVLVQALNNDKKFVLTVINWGCTIKKNEFKRIFDLETRGSEANNFQGVGSGIGLYVVARITEALDGKVTVEHNEFNHKTIMKIEIKK